MRRKCALRVPAGDKQVADTAGPGNFGLMHSGSGISAIELPEGARAAFLLIEARAPQGGGF